MPLKARRVEMAEVAYLLDHFAFTRQISKILLQETRAPAQHLTIDQKGAIWLRRNWNLPPARIAGYNDKDVERAFVVALMGNFVDNFESNDPSQRQSTVAILSLLLRRLGLMPKMIRLARVSGGESNSRALPVESALRKELRKRLASLHKAAAAQADDETVASGESATIIALLQEWTDAHSATFSVAETEIGPELEEEPLSKIPEIIQGAYTMGIPPMSGPQIDDGSRLLFNPSLPADVLDDLRPNLINLSQGRFSADGDLTSTSQDVDRIFDEHLPRTLAKAKAQGKKLKLLFYAHGGLVSESNALDEAQRNIPWWRENEIYPIFFIWETGFFEILGQRLGFAQHQLERSTARAFITDGAVEALVRSLGLPAIWLAMKESARQACEPASRPDGLPGGARYTAQKLSTFCMANSGDIELYAGGHSAGAIFQNHFVPTALDEGAPPFRRVFLLAPAVTVEKFANGLAQRMGNGIEQLDIFTMRNDLERQDTTGPIYRKSILYLIHNALEPERATPILGLEISMRADAQVKSLFGLGTTASTLGEVVFSTTQTTTGRSASNSRRHIGYGSEPKTMTSVLRRVLDIGDSDPNLIAYPEPDPTRAAEFDLVAHELSIWERQLAVIRSQEREAGALQPTPNSTPFPGLFFGGMEALGVTAASTRPTATSSSAAITSGSASPQAGRRRALCVGINAYAQSPLLGCVADAQLWANTLSGLNFEQPTLLTDQQATRTGILDALASIVVGSRAGDVVVFHYSGHGTQLPDENQDESGGDTPSMDEAICPFDYESGAFLIDDDLAQILKQTPDGVNVTCFIDCCHSGTISRLAVGAPLSRARNQTVRTRFLPPTVAMIESHLRFRRDMRSRRLSRSLFAATGRTRDQMRQVVYSACQSSELAYETNMQGDFTLRATAILRAGIQGLTHEQFQDRVIAEFGQVPRQNPMLDCVPALRAGLLLQPFGAANGAPVNTSPADLPAKSALAHFTSQQLLEELGRRLNIP
jgi:hypothetical protein